MLQLNIEITKTMQFIDTIDRSLVIVTEIEASTVAKYLSWFCYAINDVLASVSVSFVTNIVLRE